VGNEQKNHFLFSSYDEDCFVEEKTGFGRRGTSIVGKAFVERECDEVGLCEIPTL